MKTNLKSRVQHYYWNRSAFYYERESPRQLLPGQSLMLSMADLQPGEKVIEMACGTGMVTIKAALAVGPEGQVLATDISRRMMNHTANRVSSWNLPQISLYQGIAKEIDLPVTGFDAGISALRLNHFKDPAQAMHTVYQGLRAGGRASAVIWGAKAKCGWSSVFSILEAREKNKRYSSFFELGTADNLGKIFRQSGFVNIETKRISSTLHYNSPEEALDAVFTWGPAAKAYARLDREGRSEVHGQYLNAIEPFRNGTAYAIPNEFVVTRGWKMT